MAARVPPGVYPSCGAGGTDGTEGNTSLDRNGRVGTVVSTLGYDTSLPQYAGVGIVADVPATFIRIVPVDPP